MLPEVPGKALVDQWSPGWQLSNRVRAHSERAVDCEDMNHRKTRELWVLWATFLLLLPGQKRMKTDRSRNQILKFRGG